jgi:hypothetical protein
MATIAWLVAAGVTFGLAIVTGWITRHTDPLKTSEPLRFAHQLLLDEGDLVEAEVLAGVQRAIQAKDAWATAEVTTSGRLPAKLGYRMVTLFVILGLICLAFGLHGLHV